MFGPQFAARDIVDDFDFSSLDCWTAAPLFESQFELIDFIQVIRTSNEGAAANLRRLRLSL